METFFNCLLIDNDRDDCDIFFMALQEIGPACSCDIVHDGLAALEKIHNDPSFTPALIFVDMNMPLMNGKQCLVELRKVDRLQQTAIYVYSTSADPRSVQEVKTLGATDFIVKPSSFTALVSLLSSILQTQKSLS